MIRIGLTGPIGCGKSTVASWLRERPGVVVIDADRLALDVLSPGNAETAAVFARFGEALRGADGRLDRASLGRIVFGDAAALRDLEAIVHPAVRTRILMSIDDAESTGAAAIVVEAIKLVEGGLATLCDEVWLVTCDPATQRSRLRGRGVADVDAGDRIAAQGDIRDRLAGSVDRVIDTTGDPTQSRAAAEAALALAYSGA